MKEILDKIFEKQSIILKYVQILLLAYIIFEISKLNSEAKFVSSNIYGMSSDIESIKHQLNHMEYVIGK